MAKKVICGEAGPLLKPEYLQASGAESKIVAQDRTAVHHEFWFSHEDLSEQVCYMYCILAWVLWELEDLSADSESPI